MGVSSIGGGGGAETPSSVFATATGMAGADAVVAIIFSLCFSSIACLIFLY
jgi:hypothetical protein